MIDSVTICTGHQAYPLLRQHIPDLQDYDTKHISETTSNTKHSNITPKKRKTSGASYSKERSVLGRKNTEPTLLTFSNYHMQSPYNGGILLMDQTTNRIGNYSKEMEPTPIGPPHLIQVVDRIPVNEALKRLIEMAGDINHLWDCLHPVLFERNRIDANTLGRQTSGILESAKISNVQVPDMGRPSSVLTNGKIQNPSLQRSHKGKEDDCQLKATAKRSSSRAAKPSSSAEANTLTTASPPPTIRSQHAQVWQQKFQELCEYKDRFGTCHVPHNWQESPTLAKWVKRQRYQYKLGQEGKHTTLTPERQEALEGLGFIWQCHDSAWEERFAELQEFHRVHGHCRVPTIDGVAYHNPQLTIWVQCQRRQCRLFRRGAERSFMTEERIRKLDSLGFVWEPRGDSYNAQEENTTS
jgi:hypothetical protein